MSATVQLTELVRAETHRRFAPAEVLLAINILEHARLEVSKSASGGLDRVHLAALKLAGGTLAGLREAIELAERDWRDLLVAAGLANEDWREVLRCHGFLTSGLKP